MDYQGFGESKDEDDNAAFMKRIANVPEALPTGWVVRSSRSNPGYRYFFHIDTGICQWELPREHNQHNPNASSNGGDHLSSGSSSSVSKLMLDTDRLISAAQSSINSRNQHQQQQNLTKTNSNDASMADHESSKSSGVLKRSKYSSGVSTNISSNNMNSLGSTAASDDHTPNSSFSNNMSSSRPTKRHRKNNEETDSSPATSSSAPKKVRVLHILKKHRNSRNPSSWRVKRITSTKEESLEELKELISILEEVKDDPTELRATFEELARTESDCSSAKRGGDLGFFGRKKMQPSFEKASFRLSIGEMSPVVETSSGVHVILRLG